MTPQEFSIEFDILYNNLASNAAPPLNEYEKSVFLTKAQSDIVIGLYSGRNNLGLSYESSEEAREFLRALNIKEKWDVLTKDTITTAFKVDSAIMFKTRMETTLDHIPVILTSQDEVSKIRHNPFRGSNIRRIIGVEIDENHIELINNKSTSSTIDVYGIKKPSPIILPNIGSNAPDIDGQGTSKPQECKLSPALHSLILDTAVQLAKQAYIGGQTQS